MATVFQQYLEAVQTNQQRMLAAQADCWRSWCQLSPPTAGAPGLIGQLDAPMMSSASATLATLANITLIPALLILAAALIIVLQPPNDPSTRDRGSETPRAAAGIAEFWPCPSPRPNITISSTGSMNCCDSCSPRAVMWFSPTPISTT